MKASQEMTKDVFTVTESADLADVYERMRTLLVRHVPVVRNQKIVGMLSDRDVLLYATRDNDGTISVPKISVKEVMSTELVTCTDDARLGDIADVMIEHLIDALPVTDSLGRLHGIVTSTDLLVEFRRKEGVTDHGLTPRHYEIRPLL